MQFQSQGPRRSFCFIPLRLAKRIVWLDQDREGRRCRYQLMQKVEPLCYHWPLKDGNPGDVSSWVTETCNEPELDGVAT